MLLLLALSAMCEPTGAAAQRITGSSLGSVCAYAPVTFRILSDSEVTDCMMKRVGAESLDWHRARHESVVREIAWGQNRSSPVILEFDWRNSGNGTLTISDPSVPGSSFSVQLGSDVWDDVTKHLALLNASGAVLRGEKAGPDVKSAVVFAKGEVVCIDPRAAIIEAAFDGRPNATVRMDECYSDDFSFVQFLLERAVGQAHECKRLWFGSSGVSTALLAICARLSGDKVMAADAWNASNDLLSEDFDGNRQTLHDFERVIAQRATMRIDGAPVIRGRAAVAEALEKTISGLPYFDNLRISATATDDEVVIRGILVGGIVRKSDRLDYDAPYTQIWKKDGSGRMLLADWKIGKFVADEG